MTKGNKMADSMSTTSMRKIREAERRISQARITSPNKLSLNGLDLTEVPPTVAQLMGLRHLVLSNNRITSIPRFVTKLVNLTSLDLSGNCISELPEDVDT